MWPEPEGTTDDPPLPKPAEGLRYLDCPIGTTVDELKERIRNAPREVFALSADGVTVDFAPVVGERREVEVSSFGHLLRDRLTIHNHPGPFVVSRPDLFVASIYVAGRCCVTLPDGRDMLVLRPEQGWPSPLELDRAYQVGLRRANTVRRSADRALHVAIREINRSFVNAFGDGVLQIVLE